MAEPKTREELLRTLSEQELNSLEPISDGRFDKAMTRAEADRNAGQTTEQCSPMALHLRFR